VRTIQSIENARTRWGSRLEMGKEIEKRLKHKSLTEQTNKYQPVWMGIEIFRDGKFDTLRNLATKSDMSESASTLKSWKTIMISIVNCTEFFH
jgi:hypothetical protein